MLTLALIAHVILGLVGVGASYTAAMVVLRKKIPMGWLQWSALVAFLSYLLSWISGGYYYVIYYGANVKPVIKEGDVPWAHNVVMEWKEHAFLFLPVLSFLIVLAAFFLQRELTRDKTLRGAVAAIAVLTFILSVAITLAGVIISGAAR